MMSGRTTRLEFIIVTVAFLVLLLCSKPPRPGTAQVGNTDGRPMVSPDVGLVALPEDPTPPIEVNAPEPEPLEIVPSEPEPSSENLQPDAEPTPTEFGQPTVRWATVDARRCPGLKYDQPMQGEITVRWVWDGQQLVPQKVCVVREPNGVSTVWRFDEQGNARLAEVEPEPEPSR
ncbi:MAG: hypothetical protein JW993_08865 [Sedimentisphaerales bacterium]|nr:hypothetical protein [Sedimentisphaerales bacterium]